MTEAYPLQWPDHWPRTPSHKRQASRFQPWGLAAESQHIVAELQRLGAKHIVVSTNVELRRDGLPYSGRRAPDDSGVAVYFMLNGRQQCIPCDRWRKVEENARAIGKSIEAMRGLERWGAKSFVDAAFSGFQALPPPEAKRPWRDVLNLPIATTRTEAEAAYHRLARQRHPDMPGGSAEMMAELNAAIDQAREALGG